MQNTSVLLVLCDWVSLSILGSLFISIFHNLSRLEGALWTCQLYLHVYSQIQCEKLLKIDFFLSLLMKKKIWRTFTKQAGENHCLSQTLTAVKICWLFQELERSSSNFHYIFADFYRIFFCSIRDIFGCRVQSHSGFAMLSGMRRTW